MESIIAGPVARKVWTKRQRQETTRGCLVTWNSEMAGRLLRAPGVKDPPGAVAVTVDIIGFVTLPKRA